MEQGRDLRQRFSARSKPVAKVRTLHYLLKLNGKLLIENKERTPKCEPRLSGSEMVLESRFLMKYILVKANHLSLGASRKLCHYHIGYVLTS